MHLNTKIIISITEEAEDGERIQYRVESSDIPNSQTYIVNTETGITLTIEQAKKHFAILGEALKIAESGREVEQ